MKPCAVKWCVSLVVGNGRMCAVHRDRGEAFNVDADVPDKAGDCPDCDGSGTCATCEGKGEHHCESPRCYDLHECGACKGYRKCDSCHGTGNADKKKRFALDVDEEAYLKWATWSYQVPPPPFDRPWDVGRAWAAGDD